MSDLAAPPPGNANRFLCAWLLVLLFLAAIVFPGVTLLTLDFSNSSEAHWVGQLYARKERAIELKRPAGGGPMLLTFGGSAGLFAVDAGFLEQRVGLPTVNFNTHGALGLDYHLARIRRTARPGDTALLILETSMPFRDPALRENLLKETVWTYDRAYLRATSFLRAASFVYLNPFQDYRDSIDRRFRRAHNESAPLKNGAYGYLELTPHGDFIGHAASREFVSATARASEVHPAARKAFQELAAWCRENKVHLCVAAAPVCRPEPADAARRALQYAATDALFRDLGIEVWGSAAQSEYPRELFIDTPHHTTPAGRQIYTEQILGGHRALSKVEREAARQIVCLLTSQHPRVPTPPLPTTTQTYFVTPETLNHPQCVAIRDLRGFLQAKLASGLPVRFFDPALQSTLMQNGFASTEIERREASLADWLQRHPNAVFLLAQVGEHNVRANILPPEWRNRLPDHRTTSALLAPGRVKASHDGAPLRVAWHAAPDSPFAFDVVLRSVSVEQFSLGESPITINGEPIGAAREGLAVAVLDPRAGIVVERGTFVSERIVEGQIFGVTAP